VAIGTCGIARDPFTLARGRRNAAIERAGKLQMEKRPAFPHPQEEAGIDFGGFRSSFADLDGDPGRLIKRS
jgi:hypothetical protein